MPSPTRPALRNAVVFSLVALSLTVLTAGCKKAKPGGACKTKGDIQCVDKTTGVICVNNVWETLACEGPIGCMTVAGSGSCTHTKYAVGEPCMNEGEPQCSGDRKAMIKCESAHWKLLNKCGGALGCVANVNGAKCDLGAASAGDACTKENEGNASCTPDKKNLLVCKGGKMTLAQTCKGMHGCRQLGTKLECMQTIADLGDPCEGNDGGYACTPDKKSRLVCKGGKMVKERDCKCSVMIDKVNCN
jgi:hypothetical protein